MTNTETIAVGTVVRRRKGKYATGGRGTVTKIVTANHYGTPIPPKAYVAWKTGTSSTVKLADLVTGDTLSAPVAAVVSEVVTHTHYAVGGTTFGDEAEARAFAAESGSPIKKCEWVEVTRAGQRVPRHETRWTVID